MRRRVGAAPLLLAGLLAAGELSAETVAVRHAEGLVRGFLLLRSLDGTVLASGDLIQTSRGDRVTSRLAFHFKDGSIQDETAVFSESGLFRLMSDHLIQRGPTFSHPMDISIDAVGGRVTVRYREDGGGEKTIDERMSLPSDLANGMILTLLKNIPPDVASWTVSMLVATPKPRLVRLVITRAGEEPFSISGTSLKATRFNVKVELGGLAGLIAPLVGKQPHDTSVWIVGGERTVGQYFGQPLFRGIMRQHICQRHLHAQIQQCFDIAI